MYLDPQQVARALGGKAKGKQVTAPGPGHSRLDRSLAIICDPHAPDGFIVHSHACDDDIAAKDYVRERLGIPAWKPRGKGHGAAGSTNGRKTSDAKLIAAYTYKSETGEPYLRVLRYEPKTFKQQKWDGRSWRWGKPDGPKIPYNLLAVVKAETVFVCEGEKDCDRLNARGFVATTASEGAGKWVPALARWFEDKRVFIIADKDEPGRAHAQNVAWSLYSITESVRVVELPEGKDVSEWLDAGGDPATLVALCEGFPVWKYDPTKATAAEAPEAGTAPLEIAFIDVEKIQPVPVTWVWPRRVGRGKLTLLAGDPGLGKSQIVLDIIARIDPPPLKWSALRYGFRAKEDHDAEEETQARGDRCEAAPGGCAGVAGAERCRGGTLDWGYGGHVLPLAPGVWRAQERSGQATEGSRD